MLRGLVVMSALGMALALAPRTPEANERKTGPAKQRERPRLTPLVVILDGKGFQLRPCQRERCPAGQPDVPMTPGHEYDFRALREKVSLLRSRYPKDHRPAIRLQVPDGTPWWVAVKTMAALRHDSAGKPTFPNVMLELRSTRLLRAKKPAKRGAK